MKRRHIQIQSDKMNSQLLYQDTKYFGYKVK